MFAFSPHLIVPVLPPLSGGGGDRGGGGDPPKDGNGNGGGGGGGDKPPRGPVILFGFPMRFLWKRPNKDSPNPKRNVSYPRSELEISLTTEGKKPITPVPPKRSFLRL
ncbi:PREDICTED: uncharacterized protein LOC101314291 [Fragaria vesca subsp. vesca]